MTAPGAALLLQPKLEAQTPTATQGFFNSLGLIGLIALAPASILYLSFSQGGFFPDTTGLAAIGFAVALVLRTTLAEYPFAGFNRSVGVVLLGLALYVVLQLASALWSHDTARALDEYDRTLLYLLAFALFASFPRTSNRLRWLIRSLAAGMTAVCLAGLVSRVLPHVWPTSAGFYYTRLNYPLTYWNAEGLLAAVASILLIHLASSEDEHPVARVLGAIFVPATATTLLLTFSRGAVAVVIVGVVAYLLIGRPRTGLGAAVALIPTSAIALHAAYAAELLASIHPTSPAAVAQGHHVAVTVGLCMLAAGALRAVMLWPDRALIRVLDGRGRPLLAGRTVAVVTGLVAVIAVLALGLSGFIGREYSQFTSAAVARPAVTRDRLTIASGDNRVGLWRIALHAFGARPLLGNGAGTYELYYAQHRTTTVSVIDAHDLYVQALAELGIVGFIAIATLVLGILVLLAIRIRGPTRTTYAALFAVALAWAISAGVDWDWEMPAATLWLFIAAGLALASAETDPAINQSEPRNRTAMAVGCLVLAAAPLLIGVSYQRLRVSGRAFAAGNCVKARQSAFSSISLLSVRPEAYEIIGFCDLQIGFPVEGLAAAKKAESYEAGNWNYSYGLAIALAENGLDPRPAAERALRLNPLQPIVRDEVAAFATDARRSWGQTAQELLIGALQSGSLSVSNL
jgi:hypothetical protein